MLCFLLFRRTDAAEDRGSSVHSDHGERSAECVGLAQRGLISGHTELHQAKIPLGRPGEVETFGPQSSEKRNRVWRFGATRQLERHHGRNGEVQGNASELELQSLWSGWLLLLFFNRTGASGFVLKLAPKVKEPKSKTENADPNVQKEAKEKEGVKKPPKAGLLMREIHQAAVFFFF